MATLKYQISSQQNNLQCLPFSTNQTTNDRKLNVDVHIRNTLQTIGLTANIANDFITSPDVLLFMLPNMHVSNDMVILVATLLEIPSNTIETIQAIQANTNGLDKWQSISNIDEESIETAPFWMAFFERLECFISFQLVESIGGLKKLWGLYTKTWPNHSTPHKFFSFVIACNNQPKHGAIFAGNPGGQSRFLEYMGTNNLHDVDIVAIHDALREGKVNNYCNDPNVWAALLSSSTYNKIPLVPALFCKRLCNLIIKPLPQKPQPTETTRNVGCVIPKFSESSFGVKLAAAASAATAMISMTSSSSSSPPQPQPTTPKTPPIFPCPPMQPGGLSEHENAVIAAFNTSKLTSGNTTITVTPEAMPKLIGLIERYRVEAGYGNGIWSRLVFESLLIAMFGGSELLWRTICKMVYNPAQVATAGKLTHDEHKLVNMAVIKGRHQTLSQITSVEFREIVRLVVLPMIENASMQIGLGHSSATAVVEAFGRFIRELHTKTIVKAQDYDTTEKQVLMFCTVLKSNSWYQQWADYGFSIDENKITKINNAMAVALQIDPSDEHNRVLPPVLRGHLLAHIVRSLS